MKVRVDLDRSLRRPNRGVAARRVRLGCALAGLAVALATCGPGGATPPAEGRDAPGASGATITLSLTEYSINPAAVTIRAGTSVTIAARNDGSVAHALVISGSGISLATKDLAFGRGTTETITATLAAGTYKFNCPVGGHAARGMTGTITVTP